MTKAATTGPDGVTVPSQELRMQTLGVLAFAGDLSMGQPIDHSPRTALLAARLAEAVGSDRGAPAVCARLSLIRWAGCTGNAREFADLFGDDIAGRAALIADQNPFVSRPHPALPLDGLIRPLARAHCEATQELSLRLGLGDAVPSAAADLFEHWDGSGHPAAKRGEAIDPHAQITALAGDLEVFVRSYGYPRAIALIESRAGARHDPAIARVVARHAARWLQELSEIDAWPEAALAAQFDCERQLSALTLAEAAETLGDFADLKLPHAAGAARRIGAMAGSAARRLGLDTAAAAAVEHAGLVHALGQANVPNTVLERTGHLGEADGEQVRLIPHWTGRALARAPALAAAREVAVEAFERLDGSGFHRGMTGPQIGLPGRIVQIAALIEALRTGRCWRSALPEPQRGEFLRREAAAGRIDGSLLSAFAPAGREPASRAGPADRDAAKPLTARERDVLRLIAIGLSNKQMARELSISPSTAGTHVENVYRKLQVSTRAAAALKAASLGVLA